jgi:hypothetical protein
VDLARSGQQESLQQSNLAQTTVGRVLFTLQQLEIQPLLNSLQFAIVHAASGLPGGFVYKTDYMNKGRNNSPRQNASKLTELYAGRPVKGPNKLSHFQFIKSNIYMSILFINKGL